MANDPVDTHHIPKTKGSPLKLSDKQLPQGTLLVERYQIQDVIGIGGMGSVYLARDMHFPNVVKLIAIKEMINEAPDPLVRQTIVQNFEREANILVTLSHVAIPKIFDYFTFQDRSYLVIEYVKGRDLEAKLSESDGHFSEDQVIAWAIELCDVLSYLHNHKPEPIIFRDIKPSNIMINNEGQVVLVDFGIAKVFRFGQKGTMIGTEGYSPPEQYRGEASPQADVYALGATLHHLLTARDPRLEPPFTFSERPIRKANPSVSIELETVINTALQYAPNDRFPSASAMKDALMMVARKTGALTRVKIYTGAVASESNIKPIWTFKCEDEIRGSAHVDGPVVFIGSYDHNLYALNAQSGELIWKFPSEKGITGRAISQDGMVYIGSEDGFIYAISIRTGREMWRYQTEAAIRTSGVIAEGHLFTGSDDGYLYAINLNTNKPTWKVDAGGAIRSTPFVAGDHVYFGSEAGEVICVDFRGSVKWRFRTKRAVTASTQVSNGLVYVTAQDGITYAIDARTGWSVWRFRMGKGSIS
ncbi:MAG: serine/threonine-protein kinase, partial [Anaerolineae bacterium]|nr:serine/threonine-protein kinase [Anaerolineae bacterium]